MSRSTPGVLVCALAFASASTAFPVTANEAKTLGEIVVSGTGGRPELVPESPRNPFRVTQSSIGHTQVISREEIENLRPSDVFDLLNNATGIIATQSSRKGFSGLSVRGDSNFRWIVDGAYLQPTMASRIMKAIPVAAIEEVQVVRGASALTMGPLVGSASPGGAPVDGFIIVRTRKPVRSEVQARVAVESFATVQGSLWAGKTLGEGETRAYVAGLVSYADTDGQDDKLDTGAGYNLNRQSNSGMFKAGLLAGGWLVDFMAYHDDGEYGIANSNTHDPRGAVVGSWQMEPSRTTIFVLNGSKAWSPAQTTLFSLSHSKSEQVLNTRTPMTGPYSPAENDNKVTHLNLRHNIDIAKTRLVFGGDYMHWDTPTGQQYYEGIQREEKTQGWFAQIEQKLFDDKLALDASYRRDRVRILHGLDYYTAGRQPVGGVNSPLLTTNRTLAPATFFSLGASWKIVDDWRLYARYGEGEQAADSLNPGPGLMLGDDRQRKAEIGIDGRVSRLLNPGLNYFRRIVENEKYVDGYTYRSVGGTNFTCRQGVIPATGAQSPAANSDMLACYNQSNTERIGVEFSLNGNFAERSSYRTSLTHFTRLSGQASSENTPRRIADLSVSHGFGAFTVTAALKHVSRYATTVGAYTRYDLGLGYDWKVGMVPIRSTVYGRNLTDKRYETNAGIQDGGRVLGLEVLATF